MPPELHPHVVSPDGAPGLTCRFLAPADFRVEFPTEPAPDFSRGTAFQPLAIAVAPYGPLVLSLAARPAYGDGSVAEWLAYLCREEGYAPTAIRSITIGALPAVSCDALQQGDGITLHMRLVLLEDGGRLFQMSALAPQPLWSGAEPILDRMLHSLELAEIRGSGVPLQPGEADAARPAPSPNSARLTTEERRGLARAEDPGSLDPEHPLNRRLRDAGAGLPPRVLAVLPDDRWVRVGAGALEGLLEVPFGWHILDDGRRTLVFDGLAGGVQIHLSQCMEPGAGPASVARRALEAFLGDQQNLTTLETALGDIHAAGVRQALLNGERVDHHVLVRDIGRPDAFLMARVTTPSGSTTAALNLAGDLLAAFHPMEPPAPVVPS